MLARILSLLDLDMTQTFAATIATFFLGLGGYVFYSEVESVTGLKIEKAMAAHAEEAAPHPGMLLAIKEESKTLTTLATEFKVLKTVVDHNAVRANEVQTENTLAHQRIEASQAQQTKLIAAQTLMMQRMMLDFKKAH